MASGKNPEAYSSGEGQGIPLIPGEGVVGSWRLEQAGACIPGSVLQRHGSGLRPVHIPEITMCWQHTTFNSLASNSSILAAACVQT